MTRFFAISMYFSSCSMPTNFLFVFTQATAVVPLPMVKSRTVSPSRVYVFIRYSIRATGFCVGCILFKHISKHNSCLGYPVNCCMYSLVCEGLAYPVGLESVELLALLLTSINP